MTAITAVSTVPEQIVFTFQETFRPQIAQRETQGSSAYTLNAVNKALQGVAAAPLSSLQQFIEPDVLVRFILSPNSFEAVRGVLAPIPALAGVLALFDNYTDFKTHVGKQAFLNALRGLPNDEVLEQLRPYEASPGRRDQIEGYTRGTFLWRESQVVAIYLALQEGGKTKIHNHGKSSPFYRALGPVRERLFRDEKNGAVSLAVDRLLTAGGFSHLGPRGIHQLLYGGPGSASVNFYVPQMKPEDMTTFTEVVT
ncbi:MAG: hypothetical protein IPJ69_12135 [Deltaproteobacteria bacterium]|nr:MAG: hypothetical protein IPJ69_12135 [Deltaproteobacteria bacterium]